MELLNKATIKLNSHSIKPSFSLSIENEVPDPIYDSVPVDKLNKYKNKIDDIGKSLILNNAVGIDIQDIDELFPDHDLERSEILLAFFQSCLVLSLS